MNLDNGDYANRNVRAESKIGTQHTLCEDDLAGVAGEEHS